MSCAREFSEVAVEEVLNDVGVAHRTVGRGPGVIWDSACRRAAEGA
jgi:hypothetical protein